MALSLQDGKGPDARLSRSEHRFVRGRSKREGVIGFVLVSTFLFAGKAWAQVAWDAPLLAPPQPPAGFGIFLMEAADGDLGVMGTWRGRPGGLGLRFGVAEDAPFDDAAFFGGIDVSGIITRANTDFPLDLGWVAGAGLSGGELGVLLSFPVGLSLGRTFTSPDATFTPYVTPRVVVDAFFRDDDGPGDDDDLDLEFAADLGIDPAFQRTWSIRFGATLGDRDALAIGISFNPGGSGRAAAR